MLLLETHRAEKHLNVIDLEDPDVSDITLPTMFLKNVISPGALPLLEIAHLDLRLNDQSPVDDLTRAILEAPRLDTLKWAILDTSNTSAVMSVFSKLRSVTLTMFFAAELELGALSRMKRLEELQVLDVCNRIAWSPSPVLNTPSIFLPELRTLSLDMFEWSLLVVHAIVPPKLRHLTITNTSNIFPATIQMLSRSSASLEVLKLQSLRNGEEEGVVQFLNSPILSNLKELRIHGDLSGGLIQALCPHLDEIPLPRLESLDLDAFGAIVDGVVSTTVASRFRSKSEGWSCLRQAKIQLKGKDDQYIKDASTLKSLTVEGFDVPFRCELPPFISPGDGINGMLHIECPPESDIQTYLEQSMAGKLNIFFTGATGYIGGSILSRLLQHKDAASFHITALVRSSNKAEKFKTLGVDTVIGSYADEDLPILTQAASKADVVFTAVDADSLPPVRAILDGLKLKYEASGRAPILIHTSGTGLLLNLNEARGLHSEHIHYSDLETEKLDALPATALHRNVDIPIFEADKAGYVKAYIIAPTIVFGNPKGPLVDLGIQSVHSIVTRFIVEAAIARKQGGYVGKGVNKWAAVDVEDNADLYLVLFDAIRTRPDEVPRGYYFSENLEFAFIEEATAISEALVELGVGNSREPSAFTVEEEKNFGPVLPYIATNCYAKGDRGRALGWKPQFGKEAYLAYVKSQVKVYLHEQ
ncbi:unnamed protein product [Cyclocybe aegerita]|uniref:NmrA-like domain-containing protein n=1 Tax=Cyclocybe aegerita TaxID=1973307 RepID=A0A8S0WET2_CYCAE|nr:unnamed protein product [Cyclocybe aegerita]